MGLESPGETTLASRDAIAKTPPRPREISRLAGIMGESRDSGHDTALKAGQIVGRSSAIPERF